MQQLQVWNAAAPAMQAINKPVLSAMSNTQGTKEEDFISTYMI